jgi:hypothetical protein
MSKLICGLAIAITYSALVGRADAQEDWGATFSPQSVAAINAPLDTVMVIPAGAEGARPAAAALLATLRTSGTVSLVVDSSALGDVSALDDRTIVARAAGQPVATFAIVRVFAERDRPSVVVAFYDKSGRSLGSASADKGGPLSSSAPPPREPAPDNAAAVEPTATINAPPASLQPATSAPTPPPGTVPVTFTSASAQVPLRVSAYEGSYTSIESSWRHGTYLAFNSLYQPLCTTPCTLQLPPGKLELSVDGQGIASYGTSVKVPLTGADVRLRVTSPVGRYFGNVLIWPGLVATLGGAIVLGVAAPITKKLTTVSGQTITSHQYDHTPLVAGATILSVGAAMVAIGVPLVVINSGAGAASVRPRAATQPTAKLTVGPGSLGLSGTF